MIHCNLHCPLALLQSVGGSFVRTAVLLEKLKCEVQKRIKEPKESRSNKGVCHIIFVVSWLSSSL